MTCLCCPSLFSLAQELSSLNKQCWRHILEDRVHERGDLARWAQQGILGRRRSMSEGPELGNGIIFRSYRMFHLGCDWAGLGRQVGSRL